MYYYITETGPKKLKDRVTQKSYLWKSEKINLFNPLNDLNNDSYSSLWKFSQL